MSMETCRKRKKPEASLGFAHAGWKRVDVGDDLLLGSEEGGFMELEEMVPPSKVSSEVAGSRSTEQGDGTVASPTKASKQKKQKADRKTRLESKQVMKTADAQQTAHASTAPEAEQPADDVEGLRAKLAALQQENEALKCAALSCCFPTWPLCKFTACRPNEYVSSYADLAKHAHLQHQRIPMSTVHCRMNSASCRCSSVLMHEHFAELGNLGSPRRRSTSRQTPTAPAAPSWRPRGPRPRK